ncbi:hypothetical protein [Kitasatospora sp. NPDC056184]|uniref:hypothetical protein n=1 Tax=Kitasatospora sp. NPDC056184 TaxID=3345738 RepID=UPI0035DD2164
MKRFLAVLTAGAALSGLGVAGAGQAAAQATGTARVTTPSTTTCAWGPPGFVSNQVCLTISGSLASATGYSVNFGPSRFVSYSLATRITDGILLEREDVAANVTSRGLKVGPAAGNVPCGSSVTATFETAMGSLPRLTATVTAPVVC